MTRYEKIVEMSIRDVAETLIELGEFDGKYCKSDCGSEDGCPNETECAMRWLAEEVTA